MFFIFHLFIIKNWTNSIVPTGLGNRPPLDLTQKIMGISSYLSDVNFFLIVGQHREISMIIFIYPICKKKLDNME